MTDGKEYSHLMKLLDREIMAIVLYQGYTTDDEKIYAYMAVRMDRNEAFLRAVYGEKPFDLRNYGTIITAGYGDPTPEVMEQMERDYEFDHHSVLKVRQPR